jgi:hypothetical protein
MMAKVKIDGYSYDANKFVILDGKTVWEKPKLTFGQLKPGDDYKYPKTSVDVFTKVAVPSWFKPPYAAGENTYGGVITKDFVISYEYNSTPVERV